MGCLQDPPSIPVPRTFQTLGSKPFPRSPKPQGPFPAADAGFMATDSRLLWASRHVQPPGPGWLHPLPQRLLWEVKHPSPFIRRKPASLWLCVPWLQLQAQTPHSGGAPTSPSSSHSEPRSRVGAGGT